jgi:hypothetical protein
MSLFSQFSDFIFYSFSFKRTKPLKKKKEEKSSDLIQLNLNFSELLSNLKFNKKLKPCQGELPYTKLNYCDISLRYLTFLSVVNDCYISKWLINTIYLNINNNLKFKYIKINGKDLMGKGSEKQKWVVIKPSKMVLGENDKFTGREMENFVTTFQSLLDIDSNEDDLKIVSGQDITYWYQEKKYHNLNYDKFGNGLTTLSKSCMRNSNLGYTPKLYEMNPDKVNMFIVTSKDGKLKGRALLWRLDNGKILMDRCYYMNEKIEKMMYMVGILNGWIVKMHYINKYWDGTLKNKINCEVSNLRYLEGMKLPYFDTFIYKSKRKNKNLYIKNF